MTYRRTYRRRYSRRSGGRGSIWPWVIAGVIAFAVLGHSGVGKNVGATLTSGPAHGDIVSTAQARTEQAYAQRIGHLDSTQETCLGELWTEESGWRWWIWNTAGSGAYGIPQALPASKMAAAGPDWRTNWRTQIRWGLLDYIVPTYGNPCRAWAFETSHYPNWY